MPEGPLRWLVMAALVAIHAGLALVLGALASEHWLAGSASVWTARVLAQAQALRRAGLVLVLLGLLGAVGSQAAVIAEGDLGALGSTLGPLLLRTRFGQASLVGGLAGLAAVALLWRRAHPAGLLALGLLILTRSAVSHAGGQGLLSLDLAIDALHLLLACLWVGIVVSGSRLRLPDAASTAAEHGQAAHWVVQMSSTATVVLVGIAASGLYKVWAGVVMLGGWLAYLASGYGQALLVKLLLVAAAALLGGLNRFVVLPRLPVVPTAGRWLGAVLRVELLVLLLTLVAAAALSTTEPG